MLSDLAVWNFDYVRSLPLFLLGDQCCDDLFSFTKLLKSLSTDRVGGLVVKASASRAEDPGFESRLHRDFSGVESYQ